MQDIKKELKGAELSYNKLKDNTNRNLLSGVYFSCLYIYINKISIILSTIVYTKTTL